MSKAAQIRELIDAGLTNREIAEQVGKKPNHIRAVRSKWKKVEWKEIKVRDMGTYRSWSPDEIQVLDRLSRSGLTYSQLAEKFGCTRNAIAGRLNRNRQLQPA